MVCDAFNRMGDTMSHDTVNSTKARLRQALAELSDTDLSMLVLEALEGYQDVEARVMADVHGDYSAADKAEVQRRFALFHKLATLA